MIFTNERRQRLGITSVLNILITKFHSHQFGVDVGFSVFANWKYDISLRYFHRISFRFRLSVSLIGCIPSTPTHHTLYSPNYECRRKLSKAKNGSTILFCWCVLCVIKTLVFAVSISLVPSRIQSSDEHLPRIGGLFARIAWRFFFFLLSSVYNLILFAWL